MRYVGIGKAVEPADVDDTCLALGSEDREQHLLANAFECRGCWQKHRHGLNVNYRFQTRVVHPVNQVDAFSGAEVQIDVRVVVAGKHAVQRVRHALGDVAVQIKRGNQRNVCAHKLANRGRQVPFKIINTRGDTRTMQVEEYAIERH